MATIGNDPNGRNRILFVAGDGTRKTIRLGKATAKQADAFKTKIESIITGNITGGVDDEVSRWIAELPDAMHARLAVAGLVKSRNRTAIPLSRFLDDYFASAVVKASTAVTYGQTRQALIQFFGESRPLRSIEPADADKWRQWLKSHETPEGIKKLADSTISRRVKCARQMFKRAGKWKLIAENPFADVIAGSQSNKARRFFVTREMADKILDTCPDTQWKLLFALSRFGGLRCPSEHLALKWADVDWEHGRLRVPSCKTEHIEGGDCRFIPLFPELRELLMKAFDEAEPGTEHIITRCRDARQNLRTQLERIIKRAGLKSWPKLFHNLRATRQTELAEKYPIHVVCAWLGNSRAVAQEHYLQVTDAHFTQASAEPAKKAAQNPAQYTADLTRKGKKTLGPEMQKRPDLPSDSADYVPVRKQGMTPTGFEPVSRP